MKKTYVKPMVLAGKNAVGLIPVVAGIAAALGVSQAVAGLALGGAAGLGAVGAATALAKKSGSDFSRLEYLPCLDAIEVYA